MNIAMFIVGGCIFSVYVFFTIWNIFYGARKNKEENYPEYYDRHGSPKQVEFKRKRRTYKRKTKV